MLLLLLLLLPAYLRLNIALAYILVISYAWILIGPIPVTSLFILQVCGGVFIVATVACNLAGLAWMGRAAHCLTTSPSLYVFCGWQIFTFVCSVVISVGYVVWHHVKASSKQARKDLEVQAAAVRHMKEARGAHGRVRQPES